MKMTTVVLKKRQLQNGMKQMLFTTAKRLAKAKGVGQSLAPDELKSELRSKHPLIHWSDAEMHKIALKLQRENLMFIEQMGSFSFNKKGVPQRISRKTALKLMTNTSGQTFTAVFRKKDNTLRTMSCQFMTEQKDLELGYVKVRETPAVKSLKPGIRNLNIQTLESLKIGTQKYKIA